MTCASCGTGRAHRLRDRVAREQGLHSYLILAYAGDDDVSMDGRYYSANLGRLVGTLLGGLLYLGGGLELAM